MKISMDTQKSQQLKDFWILLFQRLQSSSNSPSSRFDPFIHIVRVNRWPHILLRNFRLRRHFVIYFLLLHAERRTIWYFTKKLIYWVQFFQISVFSKWRSARNRIRGSIKESISPSQSEIWLEDPFIVLLYRFSIQPSNILYGSSGIQLLPKTIRFIRFKSN